MPYIPDHIRAEVRERFCNERSIDDAGALAFIIADAIECFLPEEANYSDRAHAIGVAHTTVEEARRRILDTYEDSKRHQHGDVFSRHEKPKPRPPHIPVEDDEPFKIR
jgi:hypothetical protein